MVSIESVDKLNYMSSKQSKSRSHEAMSKPLGFKITAPPIDNDTPLELQIALLRALRLGTGKGFTQTEAEKLFDWAEQILINLSFINLALEGHLKISFNATGEIVFDVVRPSPEAGVKSKASGGTYSGPN
jgi:hypothetical protein